MHIYSGQFSQNIILKGLHVDSSALDPEQGFLALFAGVCYWDSHSNIQLCRIIQCTGSGRGHVYCV